MEVILNEAIQGLGKELDVVKVKNGYAHNYLFPRGLAQLATPSSLKRLDALRAKAEARSQREKATFQALAEKLQGVSLTIAAKVHEGEKLYGSIQAAEIIAKLREAGYDLDRKVVVLADPIKALGMYTVKLQLHKDVEAKVKLWVISDESK
ncbi:MAG TPA: 50S ribosomal protein L9 [Fibrobacteria bacterium]|nr:50S ribosomal protein L9 [Fibrobacteria bacterium]